MPAQELPKTYDPKAVEPKWAQAWIDSGLFKADPAGRDPFVIAIPPPNVTGALHLGHALNSTLQDILIRWQKLEGREVCWVPGTDHGGIATQNVMEKQLKAEGLSRHVLGREKFLERMQAWADACKKTILSQLKALGCGLDWSREAFTLDEARGKAVFHAFKSLWDKGLIYRGERLVNWCVRCGTALSDIEVEHEERQGRLWHIRYPAADGSEGVIVATTRPETMLGDTAVAVNPRDLRYEKKVGKMLRLPLANREIPIVADETVEFAFGTGAVKVTPAHDFNDLEIGRRQNLPSIKVIDPDGKMTAAAGHYAALSRQKARDKVVEDLKAGGFLEKIENHKHAVAVCYRCADTIEPLLSWQWFVKMSELAKPAAEAVEQGRLKLIPDNWGKPYLEWLKGLKDWCVSRQIWWGHRIPVWYCKACNRAHLTVEATGNTRALAGAAGVVSAEKPRRCEKCGAGDFEQDCDVLDTWFSSALWPMSVFGWPDPTEDFKRFYPAGVLVTGYEILYLWVARMQMMGLEATGKVPFHTAIIHGIVRDKKGKKMSKSLGNVIDPLEIMDRHGTDALRFALALLAHPGRDIPFAEESITGARHFANKLFNCVRFTLMNLPESPPARGYDIAALQPEDLELADRWILAEYRAMLSLVREKMDAYAIAAAADALYGFVWDEFCDWYLELAKIRLQGANPKDRETARSILVYVLTGTLKLLHPFMPFITEELFQALKGYAGQEDCSFIAASGAPKGDGSRQDDNARREMRTVMEIVTALRTLRSELNVPPSLKISALASGGTEASRELLRRHAPYLTTLARLSELKEAENGSRPAASATAVAAGHSFFVPLQGLIDFGKERQRLRRDLEKTEENLKLWDDKLANQNFISRAPESEIALARGQHEALKVKQERLKETIELLK